LGISIDKKVIEDIINCQAKAIENFLKLIYSKVSKYTPKNKDDINIGKEVNVTQNKIKTVEGFKNTDNKEDNYKMLIMAKDRTISELKSTLDVRL
jgi:hypothetical protein